MKNDRRLIVPILLRHFPSLEKATSDEVHEFLNKVTGLSVHHKETNGSAFDKWRMALAENAGFPVWGKSRERIGAAKERMKELVALERERRKNEPELLAKLRLEAPGAAVNK